MKISIVIPVYLSSNILLDFTKQTLASIKSKNHELAIYIINNYSKEEFYPKKEMFNLDPSVKNFQVLDNPQGNHVSAAWNFGIKSALANGAELVIVANNDLILHPLCIDNLVAFSQKHNEFILWSAAEWLDLRTLNSASLNEVISHHPHFSLFMVNDETMKKIGWFDENLKMAYHEDGEMHYRILLSGNQAGKTETAKFYHYGSRSIKVDDDLYEKNKRSYEDNRAYIQEKWGVDFHNQVFNPPEEVLKIGFKHPFNDLTKDWRVW